MSRRKTVIGILLVVVSVQLVGLLALGLLVYQSVPKDVLGHSTFLRRFTPLLSTVRILDRSTNILYRGPKSSEQLPSYALEVSRKNLAIIEQALPDGPNLLDDNKQWVSGEFTAPDGEIFAVKVRVRGDIFNHWRFRKKSWRIKFKKDHLFNGMREINLIIPEDRGWFTEALNMYRAEKLGLAHTPTRFVTLNLNGSGKAVYLETEHWRKEMLEKLGRVGDSNFYQSGDFNASRFDHWDPVEEDIGYWEKYQESAAAPYDSYEEMEQFLDLQGAEGKLSSEQRKRFAQLFDVDELISWYALNLLSGSAHGMVRGNLRTFFDPSLGTFTILPWDIEIGWFQSITSAHPGLASALFENPEWRLETYRRVWQYIEENEEDDLEEALRLRTLIERPVYRDHLKLKSNRQVKKELDTRSAQVEAMMTGLKEELSSAEVIVHKRVPSTALKNDGVAWVLEFVVRGVSPVVLSDLGMGDDSFTLYLDDGNAVYGSEDQALSLPILFSPEYKEGVESAPHTLYRLFLVSDSSAEPELLLLNAVTGKKADIISEKLVDDRTFEFLLDASLSRSEFLKRHPQFRSEGESGVRLAGNIALRETVIIPKNTPLTVAPGSRISLGAGVSLLSYSPVYVLGSQANRVIFSPFSARDPWGVFGVVRAAGDSKITWAEFRGGSEAYINGTFFSGQVAFHGSPVSVSDSVFRDASGDDGMNIKYVPVQITRCTFRDNQFDGLDIDVASEGTISESVFIGNGNDGLDISWSSVVVSDTDIEGSADKCFSIGENSHPKIIDSSFSGCATGIAVKDGSSAEIENVLIQNNAIGIAAYIKKPIYTAPTVNVTNSVFIGNGENTRASSGATITINDNR